MVRFVKVQEVKWFAHGGEMMEDRMLGRIPREVLNRTRRNGRTKLMDDVAAGCRACKWKGRRRRVSRRRRLDVG